MAEIFDKGEISVSSLSSEISRQDRGMPLMLIVQVWGSLYVRLFLDLMLPSIATSGNVKSLKTDSLFLIYTTERDSREIRQSPILKVIEQYIAVRFEIIEASELKNPYEQMSHCQKQATIRAKALSLPAVFLSPDLVVADGCFKRLSALAKAGVQAVVLSSIRVTAETFGPDLLSSVPLEEDGGRPIIAAKLVAMMVKHLHPLSRSLFWHAPEISRHPSHLYWGVENKGILGICAHLHPLMVYSYNIDAHFASTIDDDYVISAVDSLERIHVVTDSDEIMVVEISSRSRSIHETIGRPADAATVLQWAKTHTNSLHRHFLTYNFFFHTDRVDEHWNQAIEESSEIRYQILEGIAKQGPPSELNNLLSSVIRLLKDSSSSNLLGETATGTRGQQPSTLAQRSRTLLKALLRSSLKAARFVYHLDQSVATQYAFDAGGPNRLHYGWYSYHRLKLVIEQRLPQGSGRLLVADGGVLLQWLRELGQRKGYDVTSVAFRPGRGTDATILEYEALPPEPFDVVICLDCLEYVDEPAAVLRQLAQSLRSGGLMLCTGTFSWPQNMIGYELNRFTDERLVRWLAEQAAVRHIDRIGGATSLLSQLLLFWPRQALARNLLGKILIISLCPFASLWTMCINILLPFLASCDASRQFYSHSVISAHRR